MQHQHTLQNNGMSSLGQSLRQRIIYNNLSKNTRKVMKLEPERDIFDDLQDIIMDIVGYTAFIVAGTAIIVIISAMVH